MSDLMRVSKTGLCGIATAASYPVKTSPNPAVPEMCDLFGWTECPAKQTCSCSFSLLGWICLWWVYSVLCCMLYCVLYCLCNVPHVLPVVGASGACTLCTTFVGWVLFWLACLIQCATWICKMMMS